MSPEVCSVMEKVLVAVEEFQFLGRQTRVKIDKLTSGTLLRLELLVVEFVKDREIAAIGLIA
jgi:hypothetical protein